MPPGDKAKASDAAAEPRGSQSAPADPPEEVRYSRDDLRAGARALLGVSPHAVVGALADESAKTFTLEQAEKKVNAFLKKEAPDATDQAAEEAAKAAEEAA